MKLLLFLLLISTSLLSQISLKSVYVINTKPIRAVRFTKNNKFIVIEYIKDKKELMPQEIVDSGSYTQNKYFVKFQSTKSKMLQGNKLFLDKKLYTNWWNLGKVYTKSDTNKYHLVGWVPPKKHYKKPTPAPPIPKIADYTKQFYQRHVHYYIPQYDSLLITDFWGPGLYTKYVNDKWVEYVGDTTFSYLMTDYETVIHESTHGFNDIVGYSSTKRWRFKIMVDPSIVIYYDNSETYQSSLFKPIVPKDAPSKIFRYKTYVAPGCTVSANLSGIYGILDEFSAYRNGFHAALMSHYKAKELKQESIAQRFLGQATGVSFAYYEFRLFIAWYLAYAKTNYPKVYQGLMDNWNFRVAYTILDEIYLEDVKKLESIYKNSTDHHNSYTFSWYEENYVSYLKLIEPDWINYINDFKINGVNSKNWKEKVKPLPPEDPNVKISRF
jgi:hypothetical protein